MKKTSIFFKILFLSFLFLAFAQAGQGPEWWITQRVIAPGKEAQDFAAINLGQLKYIASQAAEAMNERLPGGAGTNINNMVETWKGAQPQDVKRQDYAAVNIGQLKAVAKPFYQHLETKGLILPGSYPWASSTGSQDNYAAANIGQAKNLFSFYLPPGPDTDNDGISNAWEKFLGSNPNRADAHEDPNNTGYTFYQRYMSLFSGNGDPAPPSGNGEEENDSDGEDGDDGEDGEDDETQDGSGPVAAPEIPNGGEVPNNRILRGDMTAQTFYAVVDLGPGITGNDMYDEEKIVSMSERNGWLVTNLFRRWHNGELMQLPPLPGDAYAVQLTQLWDPQLIDVSNDGKVLIAVYAELLDKYFPTYVDDHEGYFWASDGTPTRSAVDLSWVAKILNDKDRKQTNNWMYILAGYVYFYTLVPGTESSAELPPPFWTYPQGHIGDGWFGITWINRKGDVIWYSSDITYRGNYPDIPNRHIYITNETYALAVLRCINYDRVSVGKQRGYYDRTPVLAYKGGIMRLPEYCEDGTKANTPTLINAPYDPWRKGFYTITSESGHIWWRKTNPETGKLLTNLNSLRIVDGYLKEPTPEYNFRDPEDVFEKPVHISKFVDANCGWRENSWSIHAINDDGLLGANGEKRVQRGGAMVAEKHLALLVPGEFVQIDSDSYDKGTGKWTAEHPSSWLTQEAFPAPEVEIKKITTEFVPEGIKLVINGKVRDKIAKFLKSENEKIKQIKIFINNELKTTHEIGDGDFDKGVEFATTIIHPIKVSASLSIRVETEENIATLKGWAKAAVNLTSVHANASRHYDFSQMSFVFGDNTGDGRKQMTVSFGQGFSSGYNGVLVEETPGSYTFTGMLNEHVPIKLRTGIPGSSFPVQIQYTTPWNGVSHEITGTWGRSPSQGASAPYLPQGAPVGPLEKTILFNGNLNANETEEFIPITFRLKMINGWENNANIRLKAGDVEYPLKAFKIDGETHLYPYDVRWPEEPKIFLPSKFPVGEKLRAPGYDPENGEFKLSLRAGEHENVVATFRVEAGTEKRDPFAPKTATPASGPGGEQAAGMVPSGDATSSSSASDTGNFVPWEKPGDKVSLEEMLLTYRFIYGVNPENRLAIQVLDLYLAKGHKIKMADVMGDFSVDLYYDLLGVVPLAFADVIKIEIEEDDDDINPVVCAQLLHTALEKALGHAYFMRDLADKFAGNADYPMLLQRMQRSAISNVGEVAASVDELYSNGVRLFLTPVDVIASIGEIWDGDCTAIVGMIPVAGKVIKKGLKTMKVKVGSKIYDISLTVRQAKALEDANKMAKFSERFAHLENNGFSRETIEILVLGGGVKYAQSRRLLSENMVKARKTNPYKNRCHAHHDLPVQFEREFASKGIDINDAAYGRWIEVDTHQLWHSTGAEKFNHVWKEFLFDSNGKSLRRKKEEILEFLNTTIRTEKFPSPPNP